MVPVDSAWAGRQWGNIIGRQLITSSQVQRPTEQRSQFTLNKT